MALLRRLATESVVCKAQALRNLVELKSAQASSTPGLRSLLDAIDLSAEGVAIAFVNELNSFQWADDDDVTAIAADYLAVLEQLHKQTAHFAGTRTEQYPAELVGPAEALLSGRIPEFSLVLRAQSDYMYRMVAIQHFTQRALQNMQPFLPADFGQGRNVPEWLLIFPLPAAERDNMALHTILLGHEIGHAIDLVSSGSSNALASQLQFSSAHVSRVAKAAQLSSPVRRYLYLWERRVTSSAREIAENWIKEAVADLIAARTYGPAYLASMLEMWLALGLPSNAWSESHPSIEFRLGLVLDGLARLGYRQRFRSGPIYELLQLAADLSRGMAPPPDPHPMAVALGGVKRLRQQFLGEVEGVVLPADAYDAARCRQEISALVDLLGCGVPPSQFMQGIDLCATPASLPAILNAGWAYRLGNDEGLLELLGDPRGPAGWPPAAIAKLSQLVARAVESSEFLRLWEAAGHA